MRLDLERHRLFIISILLILIIGCNAKSRKQEEIRSLHLNDSLKLSSVKDSIQTVKAKDEDQRIQDSIVKEREKVAISDINFGINHYQYKLKETNFLKSCQHEEGGLYYLGEFQFYMKGIFNPNDSLYCIILEGDRKSLIYNSGFGKQEIKREYDTLYGILKEKYSSPNINYGLPDLDIESPFSWDNFTYDLYQRYGDASHYCECTKWEIGKKKIEIILKVMPRKWNAISLIIYREDIASRVENKNKKQYDTEKQKSEKKGNEDIKKAVEAL